MIFKTSVDFLKFFHIENMCTCLLYTILKTQHNKKCCSKVWYRDNL